MLPALPARYVGSAPLPADAALCRNALLARRVAAAGAGLQGPVHPPALGGPPYVLDDPIGRRCVLVFSSRTSRAGNCSIPSLPTLSASATGSCVIVCRLVCLKRRSVLPARVPGLLYLGLWLGWMRRISTFMLALTLQSTHNPHLRCLSLSSYLHSLCLASLSYGGQLLCDSSLGHGSRRGQSAAAPRVGGCLGLPLPPLARPPPPAPAPSSMLPRLSHFQDDGPETRGLAGAGNARAVENLSGAAGAGGPFYDDAAAVGGSPLLPESWLGHGGPRRASSGGLPFSLPPSQAARLQSLGSLAPGTLVVPHPVQDSPPGTPVQRTTPAETPGARSSEVATPYRAACPSTPPKLTVADGQLNVGTHERPSFPSVLPGSLTTPTEADCTHASTPSCGQRQRLAPGVGDPPPSTPSAAFHLTTSPTSFPAIP